MAKANELQNKENLGKEDVKMAKVTKAQVKEMLEAAKEAFEGNGAPVIYEYEGKVDISRGDSFGIAEPVYNGEAEILVDTEQLREYFNPYDFDKNQAIDALYDYLN